GERGRVAALQRGRRARSPAPAPRPPPKRAFRLSRLARPSPPRRWSAIFLLAYAGSGQPGRSAGERAQARASRRPRPALPRKPFGNGLRGYRPAEAEALERMHAGSAQEQMLLSGLDAFRGDVHAEPAPQAHDGMDDGRGIGGILEIGDEAAIDFQAVEREGAQIEQARI